MHFDSTQMLSIFDAERPISDMLLADLPPFIHGSPGIGKSALMRSIAERFNLAFIDIRLSQCDPADLNGLPDISGKRATFKTFDMFPLAGDELPNKYDKEGNIVGKYEGWLLFLDEMNSADDSRLAAAYKIVLDRMVGNARLHSRCRVAAAGNFDSDGAITNPMPTPLVSRFGHLAVRQDLEKWLFKVAHPQQYHPQLCAFLQFKPSAFYTFDASEPNQIYSCPRTLEMTSKLMKIYDQREERGKQLDALDNFATIAGLIGQGTASLLRAFVRYQEGMPNINEILSKPNDYPIPSNDPGKLFMLVGLVQEHMTVDNVDVLMKFVDRMSPEYRIPAIRGAVKRTGMALMNSKTISDWVSANADLMK